MRVDWCVSSWFRIKNTHSLTHTLEVSRLDILRPRWVVCCRLSVFVCSCLSLGTAGAGGGGRGNVALSDVYVHSGCVAAQLAECLVSLFVSVCVARACRHHLSRVHPYRAGVQSEPDCSSPS